MSVYKVGSFIFCTTESVFQSSDGIIQEKVRDLKIVDHRNKVLLEWSYGLVAVRVRKTECGAQVLVVGAALEKSLRKKYFQNHFFLSAIL